MLALGRLDGHFTTILAQNSKFQYPPPPPGPLSPLGIPPRQTGPRASQAGTPQF